MTCRICHEQSQTAMSIMVASPATAICVECGAGVCNTHGQRTSPHGRIHCPRCLELPAGTSAESTRTKGNANERRPLAHI